MIDSQESKEAQYEKRKKKEYIDHEAELSEPFFLMHRTPFATTPNTGLTTSTTISKEGQLGSTLQRPSYQCTTGPHSPRSALVWRSMINPTSLSSTRRHTPYTNSSLTDNTARLSSVAARGKNWSAPRHPYNIIVTRKALMLCAEVQPESEQGSA